MKMSFLKNREHLLVPWLLLIVYLALPSRYAMYDSIRFAQAIETGDLRTYPFWHPSHLLYELFMYSFYSITQKIGFSLTVFQLSTIQGILSSSLLVYVAGRLLVMHGIPSRWAALALSMWVGSYVVWHCATLPDLSRNALAVLVLLAAFFVIARGQARSMKAWSLVAGLLIGLAGLFHTMAVFAVPSLAYFLWKHAQISRKVSTFMTVFFVSAVTVLSSYVFAIIYLGQIQDVQGFLRWFSAPGGAEWWQSDLMRAALDFMLTSIRALLGSVTYEPLKRAVFSAGTVHGAVLLLGLLSGAVLAYWSFMIGSEIIRPSKPLTALSQAMCIWFISYLPVAVFFDKWDVRVLLYLSIPVPFLTAECASRKNLRRHQIAALITALLLFGVNGSTIMQKESKPETQRAHQLMESMKALSQDADDLFLVSMGTDALYAQYFGKRRALPLRAAETDFSTVRFELSDARKKGKRLYIETSLLDMINKGKHPSSGVLTEMIGLNPYLTRGPEDRGFSLIDPTSTK
jgi:hypothetical protein